jgi:geranylgeranyl diphosphate synthase type II
MDAPAFLREKAVLTEQALHAHMDRLSNLPQTLRDAMGYSLFAGGKRLRPALALGAAEIVGGDEQVALPFACALEMIHTYSLIHDDLPSMDDDDFRRGKPTSHKVFGEAVAILAGDALLTLAFETAAQTGHAGVVAELAVAAGGEGMVGGQVIDLESENKKLGLEELSHLHGMKTGALIRIAVRGGAVLGGAGESELAALTSYGEHLGLAFQIADDILDIVGTDEALGKPVGSDAGNNKSTYPALVGLHRAHELAHQAVDRALAALTQFGSEANNFRALARYVIERQS